MKVFISWSGEPSHSVALVLKEWLPLLFSRLDIYVSSENIEKGKRWPLSLGENLEETNVGILCLTPRNKHAPWMLFEAGALSKSLEESRVIPFLLGLASSDVEWPLAQFQLTQPTQADTAKMIRSINNALETPRDDNPLMKVYNTFWPELEQKIQETLAVHATDQSSEAASRTDRDLLEELLTLVRGQQRVARMSDRGTIGARERMHIVTMLSHEGDGAVHGNWSNPDSLRSWLVTLDPADPHDDAVVQAAGALLDRLEADGRTDRDIRNIRIVEGPDGKTFSTYEEH